jgi:hypothetical protein
MTDERIRELKKLCEEATSGPWVQRGSDRKIVGNDDKGICVCQTPNMWGFGSLDETHNNAAFIAAARTALPELLEREMPVTVKKVTREKLEDYYHGMSFYCGICNELIGSLPIPYDLEHFAKPRYCPYCGQRLWWGDTDD